MVAASVKFAESDGLKIAYSPTNGGRVSTAALNKAIVAVACGGDPKFTDIGGPVMQVDFRGQGASEAPREIDDFSINGYAADLLSVADAAGVKTPIVLGYSHAADGAALAALEEPDRVEALVLVEPAMLLDKRHLERRVKLLEAGKVDEALRLTFKFANPRIAKKELEAAIASAKEFYGKDGASFLGETLARLNSPIDEARLHSIRVPTLVVGGTRSSIQSNVARVAKAIPNASVVWIKDADHFLADRTKQVTEVIRAFVETLH